MDRPDPVQRLCQRIAELEHLWLDDEVRARKMAAAVQIGHHQYYWWRIHLGPLYRALRIVAGLGDSHSRLS